MTPYTGTTGTAEELYGITGAIPAGVLTVGCMLRVAFHMSKSASTESTSNQVKIGTNANGITGATAISSPLGVNTTTRQMAFYEDNLITSATTLQQVILGGAAQPTGISTSTTGIAPRTVANMQTNPIYISITGTKTTYSICRIAGVALGD